MVVKHEVTIDDLKCFINMPDEHDSKDMRPRVKVYYEGQYRIHEFNKKLSFDELCSHVSKLYEYRYAKRIVPKEPENVPLKYKDMDMEWVRAIVQEVRTNLRKMNINNQ